NTGKQAEIRGTSGIAPASTDAYCASGLSAYSLKTLPQFSLTHTTPRSVPTTNSSSPRQSSDETGRPTSILWSGSSSAVQNRTRPSAPPDATTQPNGVFRDLKASMQPRCANRICLTVFLLYERPP